MNNLNKIAILLLPLGALGCGDSKDIVSNPNPHQLNSCGVTSVHHEGSGFTFRCGLTDKPKGHKAVDVETKAFSEQQLCDVRYNQNGVPEYFSCKEVPESIDSFIAKGATVQGDWSCTGLDGFGGYSKENKSRFILRENGEFEVHITAKDQTDSVWHLADSIISGSYVRDTTNKLVLEPMSWESDLIKASKLSFDDAPQFMLVKPLRIDVSKLTNQSLVGTGRWEVGGRSRALDIECTK